MPSAPQTVTTRGVFDYLLNTAGKPIVGATVNCTLNFNGSSVTSPIVNVGELQQSTVTDQNGFWRFLLIPNDTLTPTGTLYSISTPNSSYDISVPSGVPDVQSSSILSNVPSVLSPAVTGLTGPITVTGNETVTGNLTVSGTTTLGSTTTTALSTGAQTVGGDLTISSAFRLLFGAAAAKIIPGATSISHRNNADAADNLLITDAGAVTVRNGFTLTAGDAVVTAGRLLVSAAAAKILGGVTSLSLRNNADTADNLLLTDAGLATLRNALLIPPAAGGTLAPTSYGTVPLKFDEQTPSAVIQVRIPASGNFPTTFRTIRIKFKVRTTSGNTVDAITLTVNGDVGTNYNYQLLDVSAAAATASQATGQTAGRAGFAPGGAVAAGVFNTGVIELFGYADTTQRKDLHFRCARDDSVYGYEDGITTWLATNAAVGFIILTVAAGNIAAGSLFVTELYP